MSAAHDVLRLRGYATALPTPFDDTGELDRATLEWLCHRQIEGGAAALVVGGTTGEAPTLSRAEHDSIVRIAVAASRGRVPVIADAGSNSTSQAIELARDAEAAGADGILSVVPYYNKPTQAGMYAHFRAIAEATGLPVILHDIPARTVCGLADDTVVRLAQMPRVIGLNDATGDITRPLRLRAVLGSEFRLLTADDATALAYFAHGGDGCISVISNVAPGLCRAVHSAWAEGQIARAQQLAAVIARLSAVLLCQSDPVPLKYALSGMTAVFPRVRLPLVELMSENKAQIEEVLARMAAEYSGYMIGELRQYASNRIQSIDQARRRGDRAATEGIEWSRELASGI
jgi:4-hydroxy-tetrahydrodipicolinate synthase